MFKAIKILSTFEKNLLKGFDKRLCHAACGQLSPETKGVHVGIIGGGESPIYASAILKQYPMIKSINLLKTRNIIKEAIRDATYIDTSPKIKCYNFKNLDNEDLLEMFHDLDIIAIMDEDNTQPGPKSTEGQFWKSADYVYFAAKVLAVMCPKAIVAVFARPVTASTQIVYESYYNYGRCEPHKIIGSTSLETMRIESYTAEFLGLNASCMSIPVVAGADPCSALPLLSKAKKYLDFNELHEKYLLDHFRTAEFKLCELLPCGPVFSTGVAAAKMILKIASGVLGCCNVTTNAYVKTNIFPWCNYFSNQILLGREGIELVYNFPKMSDREVERLEDCINIINHCENLAVELVYKDFLEEPQCDRKKTDLGYQMAIKGCEENEVDPCENYK